MVGIYAIRNIIDGRMYIGSSVNMQRRWVSHRFELKNNRHHSSYLQRAWNKYGSQNFEFVELELCEKNSLKEREQVWLDLYPNSYNTSRTAYRPDDALIQQNLKKRFNKKPSARIHRLMLNYGIVQTHQEI